MQDSKYGLPTYTGRSSMDERREELRGFTIDRINEFCGAKHIRVDQGPSHRTALKKINQKAQKEMLDTVLSASRASVESLPPVSPERERVKPPRPTLQKLSKEDDIESYLDMFERVAGQQGWPKELWATQLAGLLSGEALDFFTSVPTELARSNDAVKEAILARFQVNAKTYRLRFRGSHRGTGESQKLLLS